MDFKDNLEEGVERVVKDLVIMEVIIMHQIICSCFFKNLEIMIKIFFIF